MLQQAEAWQNERARLENESESRWKAEAEASAKAVSDLVNEITQLQEDHVHELKQTRERLKEAYQKVFFQSSNSAAVLFLLSLSLIIFCTRVVQEILELMEKSKHMKLEHEQVLRQLEQVCSAEARDHQYARRMSRIPQRPQQQQDADALRQQRLSRLQADELMQEVESRDRVIEELQQVISKLSVAAAGTVTLHAAVGSSDTSNATGHTISSLNRAKKRYHSRSLCFLVDRLPSLTALAHDSGLNPLVHQSHLPEDAHAVVVSNLQTMKGVEMVALAATMGTWRTWQRSLFAPRYCVHGMTVFLWCTC